MPLDASCNQTFPLSVRPALLEGVQNLTVFLVTVALLAVVPGANNATITRQTLLAGRRAGLRTVAGASTGIVLWAVAAAAGLSAVLLTHPGAYLTLRLTGAAILVVLGVQALWTARKPLTPNDSGRVRGAFAAGLATSLGNPKAGVVAVSLIPQFVDPHGPVLAASIGLGVLWALVSGTWFAGYVWLVDKGRRQVTRPSVQRAVVAVTGLGMMGLGVAVAAGI